MQPEEQPKEERLSWLAQEDREKLTTWRNRWDATLRESVIVTLHIRQWQPYATLTPQRMERLGVVLADPKAKAAFASITKAGHIDLVPAKAYLPIQRAAGNARATLAAHAHAIMGGYVVTQQAWDTWRTRHEEQERLFFQNVNALCANLEELQAEMANPYRLVFEAMFDRLHGAGLLPKDADKTTWVDEAIFDLILAVPGDPEEVRQRYTWETRLAWAPMADELAEAERSAGLVRAKGFLEIGELEKERMDRVAAMMEGVNSQLDQRRLSLENELIQAEKDFYDGVLGQIGGLKEGLATRGQLLGRGAVAVRGVVERIRNMNVFGDQLIEASADELEKRLAVVTTAGARAKDAALAELRMTLDTTARLATMALAELPVRRGVRRVETPEEEEEPSPVPRRRGGQPEAQEV